MNAAHDPVSEALLDGWQRDFPVTQRPFAVLARELGITEDEVIARLAAKITTGQVTRVGATCAPNTISASTLAAIAAPEHRIEEVAQIIGDEPGVNHSYLRENTWNLWFVATGPNRTHVDAALSRIGARSGLRVLDLRLVRPFNLDLGFSLKTGSLGATARAAPDTGILQPGDRALVQQLMRGLKMTRRPYKALADALGVTETAVMVRIDALSGAGIISRLGVIVRHRALGWRANAMVVWDLPADAITGAGPRLAAQPGVTLCYERTPVADVWPYRLYSMIHARTRAEALAHLERAATRAGLTGTPHLALFSSRCFKQTGAMVAKPKQGVRA